MPRQLPGHACEECRRRKLRCDRQRPQCGNCSSSGRICKVNHNRIRLVPRRHRNHGVEQPPPHHSVESDSSSSLTCPGLLQTIQFHDVVDQHAEGARVFPGMYSGPFDIPCSFEKRQSEAWIATCIRAKKNKPALLETHLVTRQESESSSTLAPSPTYVSTPSISTPVSPQSSEALETGVFLSEVVKQDLVQLFFDRVHPNIPILKRSKLRELTNYDDEAKSYRHCLFDAIYMFAAAFSSQFSNVEAALYAKCRSGLERWESLGSDSEICDIAHIQSWILITFYEFSRVNYRRGWLSAGRVFRLVQLAKLSDLDRSLRLAPMGDDSDVDLEEMRRTFWAAYCLDGLISLNGDDSTTFNEQMIYTRLPRSDADLVNAIAIQEGFLLEAMSSADFRPHSQLAECVILLNICGRIMSVERMKYLDNLFSTVTSDVYLKYDWLDGIILRRLNQLHANHPTTMVGLDSMTAFLYMMAHSAAVVLCNRVERLPSNEQNQALIWQFQQRGLWAAQEIVRLAKEQQDTALFTAHTFMPLQIYLAAVRLAKHADAQDRETDAKMTETIESSLRMAYKSLEKLTSVNRLADHYLRLLRSL
ncbi:fungal-specific transcription factor domain protein [Xylaria nigripes]|nr:fungal-specific transcription factor domain protein [Xylaria nigripes]